MKKSDKKTIVDSVANYGEARAIVLAIVKAMGEKWPEHTKLFEAPAGSSYPPPGSHGVILLPYDGGNDGP